MRSAIPKRTGLRYALAVLLLSAAPAVLAQATLESKLRDQLRQTTLALREAQALNAELKQKADTATAEAAAAKAAPAPVAADPELTASRSALRSEQARAVALQSQLDEAKKQLAAVQTQSAASAALIKQREAELQQRSAELKDAASRNELLDSRNAALVDIGSELVERYRRKTVWDAIQDREPLTGLHRVQFETLVQDYRNRVLDAAASNPCPVPATAPAP
ncbi:MAG: hypothetical protein Q8M37_07085 [Nevskia sp.]|nr:hypothetical protein [Nevskia sp.]